MLAKVLLAAQAIGEQTKRSFSIIRAAKAIANVKKLVDAATVGEAQASVTAAVFRDGRRLDRA